METPASSPRRVSDDGFTLVELLIVITIITILAGMAVPSLLRAKIMGNETGAIGSISALRAAQVSYATACGGGAYGTQLTTLGTPPPGSTAAFISADLGLSDTPTKSGYAFKMASGAGATAGPNDCNGKATRSAFYASAVPLTFNSTGRRSFATNAQELIWQLDSNIPPPEPFGAPSTPLR